MTREIVTFQNKQGQTLVGVIDLPEAASITNIREAVIVPNTGIHYRVAWHRLNVHLADLLAKSGRVVFRFDPHGIGDSEGELDGTTDLIHHYDAIQQGLFVEDNVAAIDAVMQRVQVDRVYLTGFCGGALTSMLTSGVDARVDGVVFISGPVTVSSEIEQKNLHPVYATELLKIYIRKAMSPKSWIRLLTGKSDYKLMKDALSSKIQEKDIRNQLVTPGDEGSKGDLFNYKFLDAFKATVSRKGKVLFAMAEVDPATFQFENYFRKTYLEPERCYDGSYEIAIIRNANHTFSTKETQEELFRTIMGWMEGNGRKR